MADRASASRWILSAIFGAVALTVSAVEVFVLWSAATGYWGPEWPTVGRDLAMISGVWLATLLPLVALIFGWRSSDEADRA